MENPSVSLSHSDIWLEELLGGGRVAGVKVNRETVLSISAVYACIKIISETIASLKCEVVTQKQNAWVPDFEHPLYHKLKAEPSELYTSFTFYESLMVSVLLHGNGYARIHWAPNGYAEHLELISIDNIKPHLINGKVWYKIRGEELAVPASDIIHVQAMALNGIEGVNPIRAQAATFGPGIAAKTFKANFFSNGANPSGTLETPARLSPDQKLNLQDRFNRSYGGPHNVGKTVILDHGMKYNQIGINPADAMLIQAMEFNKEDIASIYRVPLVMLQSSKKETYNNNEQSDIFFTKHTIRPWVKRLDAEFSRKLFSKKDRNTHKIRRDINSLMRGDSQARAAYYQALYNIRALNANEIRAMENMNPYEGGDAYGMPLASNTKIVENEDDK